MYNRVFKNHQVSVGNPFQVRPPACFNAVKSINIPEEADGSQNQEPSTSTEDIIREAREEAEAIIKEAQYEALRILENAQNDLNDLKEISQEEARKIGYENGFNEGKRKYEGLIQDAEAIRVNAEVEYSRVISGIEADAVNMILDIAKTVISNEIHLNRENILFLVKQALEKCTDKERAVLRIAADDYEYVVKNRESLSAMIDGLGELEIKKDCSLRTGACIIETPFGSIDASVQTKLKKIEEAFMNLTGK